MNKTIATIVLTEIDKNMTLKDCIEFECLINYKTESELQKLIRNHVRRIKDIAVTQFQMEIFTIDHIQSNLGEIEYETIKNN